MQTFDYQSVKSFSGRAVLAFQKLLHRSSRKCPVAHPVPAMALVLGIGLLNLNSCSAPRPAVPVQADFLANELWDDGLAEFNRYQGKEIRYGAAQKAEVIHILVSEHFLPRSYVKADDAQVRGTYAVLKLNQLLMIQTGVYRYQQMTSHFWRRDDGRLLRFNLTSGDSCGNTYKDVQRNRHRPQRFDYRALTYWQGMEDVRRVLEVPADGVFYDELPVWVRAFATDHAPGSGIELQLAGTIVHPQSQPLEFAPASARVEEAEHDGETRWLVTVDHEAGSDRFVLEAEWPHRLQRWDKADGGWLELIDSRRIAYWELNQPGDSAR